MGPNWGKSIKELKCRPDGYACAKYEVAIAVRGLPKNRRNLKYIQVRNYATVTEVCIKTMLKIIWYLKKKSNIISCKYNQCGIPRDR